jgi:hypothetical protein
MLCASVELDGGMAQLLAKLPQLGGVATSYIQPGPGCAGRGRTGMR